MSGLQEDFTIDRLEVPLREDQAPEFTDFWRRFFGPSDEYSEDMLGGCEIEHNRNTVYVARIDGKLVGTVHLTVAKSSLALGGLGEVLTDPHFRRRGISSRLCALACDDFRAWGGQGLFLGTHNPQAARIYHRCGFRKLPSSNVMACITSGNSPESFLVEYFNGNRPVAIVPGGPADRITMIPLILSPHEWEVMDANTNILSTRYAIQKSCMGLYPRYEKLILEGKGAWFAGRTDDGCLVGLSTACLDDSDACQVDGFAHRSFARFREPLIKEAMTWAAKSARGRLKAHVSVEDESKFALFEALGFQKSGDGGEFELADRRVPAIILEKKL